MQPGSVIDDRFVIERLAGVGGMGSVFRAFDRASKQPVALKILSGLGLAEPERFLRETRVLAELRHPTIVRFVASGKTSEGRHWLAMEWLEGEDLERRLDRGALAPAEAALVVRKAADALGVAHRRGIVHRDVKPSNLFICNGDLEQLRVLDFGIARVGGAMDVQTRTGVVLGSPGYLSPEQARGSRQVDARTDVFSLGCVLFACLTGRPPFFADDIFTLLSKVMLEAPPRVSELWPEVPPALDALAARLMSSSPGDRPLDGTEVAREIEALGELPGGRGDDTPRSPALALGSAERRLICAVLVEGPPAQSGEQPGSSAGAVALDETVDLDSAGDDRPRLPEIAHKFRGRIEVMPRGARLVIFEGGGVATDLAARAARCALAMREEAGDRLLVLVTGRGASQRGSLVGEVVDRAAGLLRTRGGAPEAASQPMILIDEATRGLLGDRFDVEQRREGSALVGERDSVDVARRLLGKVTPCVGRDREIAMLLGLFEECASEPVARVALVTGAAGVGKSRLRQELQRRLEGRDDEVEVWTARGDAMSAGAPLGLLAQAIRDAAGISGGEPIEERRRKLRARVERHVGAADAPRVTHFLGEIAGVPFPGGESVALAAARADPVLLGDQTRRAFEDLAAAECAAHPLLLVLEDLHWGDLPTVKVVDGALRNLADRPLFVLATARPEVGQLFPSLWAERDMQEVRVGALTPRASERLVRSVLGDGAERAVVERIVARAAGHPLHLEEIVRAVAEGGGEELPDTVLAMVQARLDALEPEARRLLRAASVFGRNCWARGVGALLGGAAPGVEADAWLRELCEREWLTRRDVSSFPGEDELSFRQDLVREAAYATLTKVDRAVGHRLAGTWLAAAGEASALVLARHFELGGEAARAAEAYAKAAEQALEGNDFNAALAHGDRAARLGAAGATLGQARAVQAEAHQHLGEFDAARARGVEAMRALDRADPVWPRAAGAAVFAGGKLGDVTGVESVAGELLAQDAAGARGTPYATACANAVIQLVIAGKSALAAEVFERLEQVGAAAGAGPSVAGQVARAAGIGPVFRGETGRALTMIRAAVRAFEAAGDLRNVCSLKKTQGFYACECGAVEEGERTLREAMAVAERMGLVGLVIHAKHDIGGPLIRLGKLDEAERFQREALVSLEAHGDRRLMSYAHGYLSWIQRLRGDHADAEREARLALDLAPSAPVKVGAQAHLAAVLLAAGRAAEAAEAAREGLRMIEAAGGAEEGVTLLHLTLAEALDATGRREEARSAIATARDGLLLLASRIGEPELQASFLARITENARTLELAGAWLARG